MYKTYTKGCSQPAGLASLPRNKCSTALSSGADVCTWVPTELSKYPVTSPATAKTETPCTKTDLSKVDEK